MNLDIVIPSLHRRQKLDTCLNSIFKADGLDNATIHLYLSDADEYQHYWSYFDFLKDKMKVTLLPAYRVPDFWNGHLKTMTADAMMCCNDDCEFHKDTITSILREFPARYPDNDGILAVEQSNAIDNQGMEGAFPVIGTKFADRFPERQVWCPDYNRLWADNELMDYARSINKFYFSRACKIVHWHPAFGGQLDQTHLAVREFRDADRKIYRMRNTRQLLWGRTFERLGEKCIKLV